MSDKETGGPAFPSDFGNIPESVGEFGRANGLTLRDYFAGKALQGIIAADGVSESRSRREADSEWTSGWAYAYADAMIAERAK